VHVLAVVVATGSHVLEPLTGAPLVGRSVRAALDVPGVDRVAVLAPEPLVPALRAPCAGPRVTVHGTSRSDHPEAHAGQRPGSAGGDGPITAGTLDVLLVLDAARPFVPVALGRRVVGAVRAGHRAVVPVLPLSDTVKLVDGAGRVAGTPDRGGLRVVQTPQGFHPSLLGPVLAAAAVDPVRAWTGAGGPVHTVEGDPLAFPVHDDWHRDLASCAVAAAEEER
jgi:2-C-methyl-D-erythritol 4-phosphate cytidylyltransferase